MSQCRPNPFDILTLCFLTAVFKLSSCLCIELKSGSFPRILYIFSFWIPQTGCKFYVSDPVWFNNSSNIRCRAISYVIFSIRIYFQICYVQIAFTALKLQMLSISVFLSKQSPSFTSIYCIIINKVKHDTRLLSVHNLVQAAGKTVPNAGGLF